MDLFAEVVDLNTVFNQGIFDVYLGLTASGYDLADPNRVSAICAAVMAGTWSQQTLQYFSFARINDSRINPYWPRASILTSVSLLIGRLPVTAHLARVRAHLASMSNLSPAVMMDEAMIHWAADLPRQTEAIRTVRMYAKAWGQYQQVIQSEINENGIRYQQEVLAAQCRLHALLPPNSSSPQVLTILNPLQADPLTDVVSVCDRVYVVTSHLHAGSYVHELIHILLDPWLRGWADLLSRNVSLLDPVYDRMAHLTYAWDRSAASWNNVFSETLVRVLTVFVSDDRGPEWQASQIAALVQQGFVYARPITETIIMTGKEQSLSDEWLDRCLRACAGYVKQGRGNRAQ
jgi:hypothetical protein